MKNLINLIFIFAGLFCLTAVNAQEGYLCVSEAAGGVSFDKNTQKWQGTVFRNTYKKTLIHKKDNKWTVKEFDNTLERDCVSPNEYGFMFCDRFGGEFKFNTKNGRYIKTYSLGYFNGVDNNDNTPFIEIGVCTKL